MSSLDLCGLHRQRRKLDLHKKEHFLFKIYIKDNGSQKRVGRSRCEPAVRSAAPTAKSLSDARKLRLFTWIPVLTYLRH